MPCGAILSQILSRGRFGIRPGTERMIPLLRRLGGPQEKFPSIHVVGTNGKGSTSAFLSSILGAAGYRVGLFTSPHLISFTERIRVGGEEIDSGQIEELGRRVLDAAPPDATFFELVTALGLFHFACQGVDVAVVEAGMGGRSDATGAADGILTVITPVGLDHARYLGSTRREIAAEKAGILRPGRPAVIAPQPDDALAAIREHCTSGGNRAVYYGTDFSAEWQAEGLDYQGLTLDLPGLCPGIPGPFQRVNGATALAAAEFLAAAGFILGAESLRRGIDSARWPGRMELFPGSPRILLDGAHNPDGAAALADGLRGIPRRKTFLVLGIMADKNHREMAGPLLPLVTEVFAVSPSVGDPAPPEELCAAWVAGGVPATAAGTPAAGLRMALAAAGPEDLVVVAGSLYLVGEIRAQLLHRDFEPCRG